MMAGMRPMCVIHMMREMRAIRACQHRLILREQITGGARRSAILHTVI
jgi:hypothetical protein